AGGSAGEADPSRDAGPRGGVFSGGSEMKPSLSRWVRLVPPPGWSLAALFVLCGVFEIFSLWLRWQMNWQQPPTDFFRGRDLICILAALVLGNYRISAFHPQFDHDYLSWLWLTPWK